MAAHLLLVTLGPVQSFIAQARRTRDLWFGSHVLSELSREAATVAMTAHGAALIVPASAESHDTGLPNKLLLRLTKGDPREVARAMREAARARLLQWGMAQWAENPFLVDEAARKTAEEQLGTLLEFHAAWSEYSDEADYHRALHRVETAVAEHKRLYACSPWVHQRGGVHKSSLDGARESVLRPGSRQGKAWTRYRIGQREQLDAIGLLKRTGKAPGQFVPVTNIGLAAYTLHAASKAGTLLKKLVRECERFHEDDRLTRIETKQRDWVQALPFDAQLLLPERWRASLGEQGVSSSEADAFGERCVRPLLSEVGDPFPYVACLHADGDRMGPTIEALATRGFTAHQALSRALTAFAAEARRIVEAHRGVLVYAGGDDVLAFVGLTTALPCADALRRAFLEATRGLVPESPTLSVGIGIGHVLESLGELLDLGRRAEKWAKGKGLGSAERNGLGFVARLHSGREHIWRAQWSEAPVEALGALIELRQEGRLPLKKVQEVEALLGRMPTEDDSLGREDREEFGQLLAKETRRVLGRVERGSEGEGLKPEEAGLSLTGPVSLGEARARVSAWVARVWLAELFSRATPGARGEEGVMS